MFHPPLYSTPPTTQKHCTTSSTPSESSPHNSPKQQQKPHEQNTKYSPHSSPRLQHHIKKQHELKLIEDEIDQQFKESQNNMTTNTPTTSKQDDFSPYFTSKLKKVSPTFISPLATSNDIVNHQSTSKNPAPKKPPRRRQIQKPEEENISFDNNSTGYLQRFKPYDKTLTELPQPSEGLFSSFISLSINDKLSDLESSIDSSIKQQPHTDHITTDNTTTSQQPLIVADTSVDSETVILSVVDKCSTVDDIATYCPIGNRWDMVDGSINQFDEISELEYSVEPRNFSRPFIRSPIHSAIQEENEIESSLTNGHCSTTSVSQNKNGFPSDSFSVDDNNSKDDSRHADFTATGKYDTLLPITVEDPTPTSTLPKSQQRKKKSPSPSRRRQSEDVSAYVIAKNRKSSGKKELNDTKYSPKRGKLKSVSSTGTCSKELPKIQKSLSPSASSGLEESLNWKFMSPSEYNVKPACPPSDKVVKRKSTFLSSFLGEKTNNIFNPKKVTSVLKYLSKDNVHPYSTNERGDTVLHCYLQMDRPDKLDLVLAYLVHCNSKLLDINKQNVNGDTPLHIGTKQNDIWCIKALICFGADINSTNTKQETPLDLVTEHIQKPNSNWFDELHELFTQLHAIPGGRDSPYKPHLFDESLNSLLNESYEIEEDVQLGVYLDEKRLAAFVFKFEELLSKQNLEFSVNNGISLPVGQIDPHGTFFDPMIARQNQLLRITEWKSTLEFRRGAGSRMLFLDGGGIRGLIQIEILYYIECMTGRKITELFDWIIGTSTGGIIALGLVYLGMSLNELRQLYFQLREDVFAGGLLSISRRTETLEHMLKQQFKDKRMNDVDYPKVLITAVSTKVNPPTLHFFNNCFDNKFSDELVWKVARYTSAGPTYFSECDDYIDGGVLANNPSMAAWVEINNYHEVMGLPKLKVALAVSVGSGNYPTESVGETDFFGKGWLDIRGTFKRAHRFIKMLSTALVESDYVAQNFATTCAALDTKCFRFSPSLLTSVRPDETDPKVLLDMIIQTKVFLHTQSCKQDMDRLVRFFRHLAEISRGLNLNK